MSAENDAKPRDAERAKDASVSPETRAFVSWVIANGRILWVIALLFAIPSTLRTAHLYAHLRSDVEALLPRQAPSVRAVDELRARAPGIQHLGVIVDTGTAEHVPDGERFIDDLAKKIRTYPPELVGRVRVGDKVEHDFLETNAALYVEVPDLKEIQRRIEARRDWDVSHETGTSLDDDDAKPPPLDFSDIKAKYESRTGGRPKAENGRYSSKELHLTMLLIEVAHFETGRGSSADLLERVKADVDSLGGPGKYAEGMRVGYTGDVAISVEETSALMSDLSVSSVVVIVLVVLVLVAYYRWWRSVAILVPPLLLAAVYSFAIASLPPFDVAELNSNTAFLGSIIVGNGINFGIMLLARYVEERRRGVEPKEAIAIAVQWSRAGTLSAALAAGASYAALAITEFQGFRQFGYIGGIGMVLSWVLAYVLMPPLTVWLDTGNATAPHDSDARRKPMSYVARVVLRWPRAIALTSVLVSIFCVWRVHTWSSASLEYDFSKLRRKDTWVSGEGYWGRKMDTLLGTYLTPLVVMTDNAEDARTIERNLRDEMKHPPLETMLDSVRTVDDVVPTEQDEKIEIASVIRQDMTPNMRAHVAPDKRDDLDRFLGKEENHRIEAKDVPQTLKSGLSDREGHLDRAVLIFPKPSHALWEGPAIIDLVARLRAITTTDVSSPARLAGSLPVSADILSSIERDGPRASLAAFLGVVATVVLIFRRSSTSLLVLGSLVTGVLWLAASTMVLGVKINFANFIAFPITFGIGVDYSVNVISRWSADGKGDLERAIRATGGGVALCSMTTIIGYSSLLMAENRALYLFGLLAVMGEVCCLTTAVVALPAAIAWWRGRAQAHRRA